ncbi:hypothetical protein [Natrinema sp. SYSU A 869]|nr:hypothetical protein [Natrinema sp. SYSU A 869]
MIGLLSVVADVMRWPSDYVAHRGRMTAADLERWLASVVHERVTVAVDSD